MPDVLSEGHHRLRKLSSEHEVNSVSFFIVNDEFTLSGAQQQEIFLKAAMHSGPCLVQQNHLDDVGL